MNILRLVIVSARVATLAFVTLFAPGQASAALCIDMHVRLEGRTPSAALVESMKNEAASIWEPYGVWFRWEASTSVAQCAWTDASFEVRLDYPTRRLPESRKTVLGSTHLALRAIDHVPIHIDRDATEGLLGSASVGQLVRVLGRLKFGPEDVGRAIGRVLAHEVGHVLLAVREHKSRGLMRPSFGVEDLLEPERRFYSLSSAEVTRLRQRERVLHVSGAE
jgi:hypothetical protein